MLNNVEARTSQGVLLDLPMRDASEGIYVQNIDGLDPVKATVVTSSFAQQDGTEYQTAYREDRNIIMTLGLEQFWEEGTVRDIRDRLYDFFMPKSQVNLQFLDTKYPLVGIDSVVESFVAPLFAAVPTATISFICANPDFITPTSTIFNGMTTTEMNEVVIPYYGSVESGFEFKLFPDQDVTKFDIYMHREGEVVRKLEFTEDLIAGDVLTISTVPGAKRITLTRDGADSSMLFGMPISSTWLELVKGNNLTRVYTEGGTPIPYTIEYKTRYGGL